MKDSKELLEELKKRNSELKPIVFVSFNTEEELLAYRKKISKERDEYYDNQEKIEQLEWELKTLEEKEKFLEEVRTSKLKREGKL